MEKLEEKESVAKSMKAKEKEALRLLIELHGQGLDFHGVAPISLKDVLKKIAEAEIKAKEEEASKLLIELSSQAMKFDGIASKRLKDALKKIPRILEQSRRVERARSEVYSKKFSDEELKPFLTDFVMGLSEVTEEVRGIIGIDAYLDIRGGAADFLEKEGAWGECMGTTYQLDYLFESYPEITQDGIGHLVDYRSITIALIVGLKVFNALVPKLKK